MRIEKADIKHRYTWDTEFVSVSEKKPTEGVPIFFVMNDDTYFGYYLNERWFSKIRPNIVDNINGIVVEWCYEAAFRPNDFHRYNRCIQNLAFVSGERQIHKELVLVVR